MRGVPSGMRRALPFLAILALGCSERPRAEPVEAPPEAPAVGDRLAVIDGAPPEDVLRYFSGSYPNLMNHPAIWWTRGEDEVVVSGRGTLERFERTRIDEALAR